MAGQRLMVPCFTRVVLNICKTIKNEIHFDTKTSEINTLKDLQKGEQYVL